MGDSTVVCAFETRLSRSQNFHAVDSDPVCDEETLHSLVTLWSSLRLQSLVGREAALREFCRF
jgi:hypothetical protein